MSWLLTVITDFYVCKKQKILYDPKWLFQEGIVMPQRGTSIHENALYSEQDRPTREGRQGSSVASLRRNMSLWMPLGTIICCWPTTAKHEEETLSSLASRW